MTARLNDAERSELAKALRARRKTLGVEIAAKLETQENPAVLALRNRMEETDDWAVADLETALDVAEVSRDAGELRDVESALTRVADGTYGECVECAKPIPYARLAANPSAARCVPCQERVESAQRRGPPASL